MPNWVLNLILIAVLIIIAIAGSTLGFGKSLKFTTSGIAGIIISIVFILFFGMGLLATPAINNLVARGNEFFREVWSFLGVIRLATVLYFIALFAVIQIIRIIIVQIIKRITEIDKRGIKVVNKILGAVYLTVFVFFLFLLILATIAFFEGLVNGSLLGSIEGSWIYVLYRNNFIVFGNAPTTSYYPYP